MKNEAQVRMKSTLEGLKAFRWLADHQFVVTISAAPTQGWYRIEATRNDIANDFIVEEGRYLQETIYRIKQKAEDLLVKKGLIPKPTIEEFFSSIGGSP